MRSQGNVKLRTLEYEELGRKGEYEKWKNEMIKNRKKRKDGKMKTRLSRKCGNDGKIGNRKITD